MPTDMTPKERIGAFLAGKPVDRVPCVPLVLNHSARLIGMPIKQYATDGAAMGRANVAAYRRYGQDLITLFSDTAVTAEALGTGLTFPEDDVPRVTAPCVGSLEEALALAPVDARTAGRLPVLLEAVRHCVKEVGDEVFVGVCYPAPFSTAAALRGTAMLARDVIRRPELVNVLIEQSTELCIDFADAVAEVGGIPMLVDPVATGSILSRRAFETFALPGIRRVMAHISSLGMPTVLHICGRTSGIIDLMADSGSAVLSIDQITLTEARQKVGDRVCLMGNIRPTETLLGGAVEDVRREALQCMADCADSPGGFILATGCEVPIDAPPENVLALMDVARGAA
jgi:uroporphyrinogen decarboxylase